MQILFFQLIFLHWMIIVLKCCTGFYCATMQISHNYTYIWVSQVAQLVKNLPAVQETWV